MTHSSSWNRAPGQTKNLVLEMIERKNRDTTTKKVAREIERLKGQSNDAKAKSNWISSITGSFEGDEDFDEILRLGREERQDIEICDMK